MEEISNKMAQFATNYPNHYMKEKTIGVDHLYKLQRQELSCLQLAGPTVLSRTSCPVGKILLLTMPGRKMHWIFQNNAIKSWEILTTKT